jgi:hypothetical protein
MGAPTIIGRRLLVPVPQFQNLLLSAITDKGTYRTKGKSIPFAEVPRPAAHDRRRSKTRPVAVPTLCHAPKGNRDRKKNSPPRRPRNGFTRALLLIVVHQRHGRYGTNSVIGCRMYARVMPRGNCQEPLLCSHGERVCVPVPARPYYFTQPWR